LKTLWVIGAVAALFVALFFSANYIVARVIEERLPKALEGADGQPVKIVNVSANLWRLRAYADELVFGSADAPYLEFKNVYVELNARALFSGTISIDSAGSSSADIYPSRWTQGEDREATDFTAADRWIPKSIVIDEAELWESGEVIHTASNMEWHVTSDVGREVVWNENRDKVSLRFQLTTDNHLQIFNQKGADLNYTVSAVNASEPLLAGSLKSKPNDSAMATTVEMQGRGFRGTWEFETDRLFAIPATSSLKLEKLSPDELTGLAPLFSPNPEPTDGSGLDSDFMHSPLPALDLPDHKMELVVVEMVGIDDEQIRNITGSLITSAPLGDQPSGFSLRNITAELPRGDLAGSVNVGSGADWQVSVDADIVTRSRSPERLRQFASTEWLWESGEVSVTSTGNSLATLIDGMRGELDIEGIHRGLREIPIGVKASLNDRRGRIGADVVELSLGSSRLKGRLWLEETSNDLYLRLHTASFDLTEFARPAAAHAESDGVGWKVPDLGFWDSKMQIDARITADQLRTSGGTVTALDFNLQRATGGEVLHLSFSSDRVGSLHAQGQTTRNGKERQLDLTVQAKDIAAGVFDDSLDANLSGQLRLQGVGTSFPELVSKVTSRVVSELQFNQSKGTLSVSGNPTLISQDDRIVGLSFENIKVAASGQPLTAGRFSYDIRVPVITGELTSASFDLDQLLAVLPPTQISDEKSEIASFGTVLSVLPDLDIKLQAAKLSGFGEELSSFSVRLENKPDDVRLHDLKFHSRFGDLQASAYLKSWQETAEFEFDGKIGDLVVSSIVTQPTMQKISDPLAGTIKVSTSGDDWQTLTGNLSGHVRLQTGDDAPAEERVEIDLVVQREAPGVSANLNKLIVGSSNLQGKATFVPGDLPMLTITATSDQMNLLELDKLFEDTGPENTQTQQETLTLAAQADQVFESVRRILGSPFQFFAGDADADSKEFFSKEPVDVDVLKMLNAKLEMDLADIVSDEGVFSSMSVAGSVTDGILDVQLQAKQNFGGTMKTSFRFDANPEIPEARIETDMRNFRPGSDESMAPSSIYAHLEAQGDNEAALAGSANGELYIEGGKGDADFANFALGFFTADLLSRISRLLLPEDDDDVPKLNCTVAFGQVTDGVLVTPKAMVIQSRSANVLIRAEVDFKKERIAAQFDSRSRTGAGLSVGNVFSNTVRIRGSLKNPGLAPNTTGILWRGWAALATGGLSLLGESFVKRVLSSDKACEHVREDIQKLVCDGDTLAASSPLVCPGLAAVPAPS